LQIISVTVHSLFIADLMVCLYFFGPIKTTMTHSEATEKD